MSLQAGTREQGFLCNMQRMLGGTGLREEYCFPFLSSFLFFLFFFFFLLRGVREGCAYLGKSVVCYSGEMLHKVQKILHTIFLAL